MRAVLFSLGLLIAQPAHAAQGVFVWNDPNALAIRMITFERENPAKATHARVLAELTSVSETMTGVSADGKAIGLCRHELDGNEAPAWLIGYDSTGRQVWEKRPGDYLAALQGILPAGFRIGYDANWFTFSCADAGSSGKAGELAFDVGFYAGKPEPDGRVISDKSEAFRGRLILSAKTGKVIAAALVQQGASRLRLGQNPVAQIHIDPVTGEEYVQGNEPSFILPKGGRGRVLWGNKPIRWQGAPVVEGYDFAWYLPDVQPKG